MLNLRLERQKKGLSQSELAKTIGTKPQSISNWENGVSTPHYKKLKELEKFFDKTIDELFKSEDERVK